MSFRLIGAAALAFALFGGVDCSRVIAADGDKPKEEKKEEKKADAEPTALDLLQEGLQNAQKGDFVKATEFIEKAIKKDPKDRRAPFILGAILQHRAGMAEKDAKRELIIKSADALRQLKAIDGKLVGPQENGLYRQALYTEATVYAVEKKTDKALASLKDAVDAGFSEVDALNNDEDFDSIRKNPEFTALVEKVAAAAKKEMEAMVAGVKKEMHAFKTFPFTFSLPDLEDKTVKLADFKGKVTIVDVWGTWCPPCREEIPHFVALKDKYAAKGLAIVGINYERGDQAKWKAMIGQFAKENKMNYPCVIGDEKTQDSIPEFTGFPTTLFIDRGGKVRFKMTGSAPYGVLEAIVLSLLDEAANP